MSTTTPISLDFDQLPKYQKRKFVPENFKAGEVADVQAICEKLLSRSIQSAKDLEEWLIDRSELESVMDQEGSIRYIRMTCQTDDASYASVYQHFIEHIVPAIKPLEDQLNQKYFKEMKTFKLDPKHYEVYNRGLAMDVSLFVQENIALQTKVDLLSQEYQKICGAMTVNFQGKEQTLPQMGKYLLEPDRALRESAWRATAKRRLQDKDKVDQIFDQMLNLRDKIAQNAKCQNFCDYKFRSLHRFDYTPEDCKKYHQTVERLLVPLWSKILERRKKEMKLDSLRPWDLAVDPLGRAPLKPFTHVTELIGNCQEIFKKVEPLFGEQFKNMADLGLLDLASRKGKAPGGYQSALQEVRKPFIFMNAVGVDDDVRTLLHEGGHAFHSLACCHHPLYSYRHGPMEFNEVASMSMELLGGEYLPSFYKPEDEERSRISHLEDIISLLIWVATIDAFQHWIYENPKHSSSDRKKMWLAIRKRFGDSLVDWSSLDEEHSFLWHRQLHVFEVPFYYIEYGIAQLGALQVWFNAKKDWTKAIKDYRQGLSLGGSRPLPELFRAAGIRFDFSESTIAPLMDVIKNELAL